MRLNRAEAEPNNTSEISDDSLEIEEESGDGREEGREEVGNEEFDENGNLAGTLYDAQGNPVQEPESDPAELSRRYTEQAQATQETQQPEEQPRRRTTIPLGPDFSPEEMEWLNNEAIENPANAMIFISRRVNQRGIQANASANARIASDLNAPPEFMQAKGAAIQRHLASLPPEQLGNEYSVQAAMQMAIAEEARETGDVAGVLEEYAQLLRGKQKASQKPLQASQTRETTQSGPNSAPARKLAPIERTPTGAGGGGTGSANRGKSRVDQELDAIIKEYGPMTRSEARDVLSALETPEDEPISRR